MPDGEWYGWRWRLERSDGSRWSEDELREWADGHWDETGLFKMQRRVFDADPYGFIGMYVTEDGGVTMPGMEGLDITYVPPL